MGDTDVHSDALIWLREALQDFLANWVGWYVASNIILYWDYDNPNNRRDPDILVARDVGSHTRRSFRVWEEGALPCALFEVLSRNTWREDVGPKRTLYARIGIREYFLFDPEHRYIKPALQGFRLRKGVYVPIRPARDGSLTSKELGLRLVVEGRMLRLVDLATGQPIPTRLERAEQEKKRADELAAEVKRLRAELKRRRKRSQE